MWSTNYYVSRLLDWMTDGGDRPGTSSQGKKWHPMNGVGIWLGVSVSFCIWIYPICPESATSPEIYLRTVLNNHSNQTYPSSTTIPSSTANLRILNTIAPPC